MRDKPSHLALNRNQMHPMFMSNRSNRQSCSLVTTLFVTLPPSIVEFPDSNLELEDEACEIRRPWQVRFQDLPRAPTNFP
jgi:hypothetical protein